MEDIITSYNKQSVNHIKSQKYQQAFSVLMKCLKLLDSIKDTQVSYPLLSMTYSNFSALYKETGKLKESNKFLLKVIEIEKKFPANKYNSINAYLSLCSNFSLLNEHEIALRNGLTGLMLLQKEFPLPEILVSTTVIAYHNVGVEYEYLSRIQEAVDSYYKGWTLAKSRLGLTHSLTLSIKNSFLASSNSNKLPGVTVRTNSQYAYKRADLAEQSIHTGSTSSSGATETRNILTPRLGGNKRRIARGFDKFKPKIDLITQRNNEKNAAVTIQAWWRGIRQRRIFKKVKMKFQLKKAAVKAQAAYQEFKMLKEQFSKKNIRMSLDEIQNFSKRVKSKSINPPGGHARAKFKNVNKSDDFPPSKNSNALPEKIFQIKSTNNQIPSLKSRAKKKNPISLQQFHKLHLEKVVKIQAFARMIGVRAKYEKIRSAVIIIQKNYRMYLCFKVFKSISTSLHKIKGDFRVYRQRFVKQE